MKHYMDFLGAYFIDNPEIKKGFDKLYFPARNHFEFNSFPESLFHVIKNLPSYDIKPYLCPKQREIFYLYNKNETDEQLLLKELDKIIRDGNIEDILRPEDIYIKESAEGTEFEEFKVKESIFWDTVNHFALIIIGRENLGRFVDALHEEVCKICNSKLPTDHTALFRMLKRHENIGSLWGNSQNDKKHVELGKMGRYNW